jgi:8-oxo-dGTP diphosphatase
VSSPIETVAWVRVEEGRILCTRSRGKDVFYIPGGKLEVGETDVQALLREIKEELTVDLVLSTVSHIGTYSAQAHGQQDGILVRMTCYAAEYRGTPAASSEIAQIAWLPYQARDRVAPVDQLLFDDLHTTGHLT